MTKSATLLVGCVALALIGALAWGGATHPPALHALMPLASLAVLLAWGARARLGTPRLSAPACVLALVGLASALMLVPLPTAAGWRPMTSDVGATCLVVARLAALVAFAIAFASVARVSGRALSTLVLALLVLALGIALVAALGIFLPAPLIAPEATRAWLRSPLQNPNHFGALVAMLLPCAWVALLRAVGARRIALGALVLGANVALWATRSRGALVCGALGQVAVLWMTSAASPRRRRLVSVALGAAALVALGIELVARTSFGPRAAMSRLSVWRDALHLLRDHPLLGVGPGAFGIVFPRYSSVAGQVHHAFVENQYLELVLELGIPIAAALLVAMVVVGARAIARLDPAHATSRAAAIGLGVLALHEVADFSTWGGAVALTGLALVALATEGKGRVLGPVAIAVVASLPLVGLAASLWRPTPDEDRARLEHAILTNPDAASVDALSTRARSRHPEDPEIPLLAAARLDALSSPLAAPWVELGLRLAPRDPRAHANAAWLLARAGFAAQAADELGRAAEGAGDRDRGALQASTVQLFATRPALLLRALPHDDAGMIVGVAKELLGDGRPLAARILLDGALQRAEPGDAASRAILRERVEVGIALAEGEALRAFAEQLSSQAADANDHLLAMRAWAMVDTTRVATEARLVLASSDEPARVAAVIVLSTRLDPTGAREAIEAERARAVMASSKATLLRRLAELDDAAGMTARAAFDRAEAARLER